MTAYCSSATWSSSRISIRNLGNVWQVHTGAVVFSSLSHYMFIPSISSDTGILRMSPVNSHVVCLASMPDVPSNTWEKTQRQLLENNTHCFPQRLGWWKSLAPRFSCHLFSFVTVPVFYALADAGFKPKDLGTIKSTLKFLEYASSVRWKHLSVTECMYQIEEDFLSNTELKSTPPHALAFRSCHCQNINQIWL